MRLVPVLIPLIAAFVAIAGAIIPGYEDTPCSLTTLCG